MRTTINYFNGDVDQQLYITNPTIYKKGFVDSSIFCTRIFGNMLDDETVDENNDDTLLEHLAYISFGDFKLINPILFIMLSTVIRENYIFDIINVSHYPVDNYGKRLELSDSEYTKLFKLPLEFKKYAGIGIDGLEENLEDILKDLEPKDFSKVKKEKIEIILEEHRKNNLFIEKFPVFTHKLRPAIMYNNNFLMSRVNTVLNKINKKAYQLRNLFKHENRRFFISSTIFEIQKDLLDYQHYVIDELSGKNKSNNKGVIRDKILGNRLDYTGRGVLTPSPLPSNIIQLPYIIVIKFFEPLIINYLVEYRRMDMLEAVDYIESNSLEFNEDLYNIIRKIKHRTKLNYVLLNRNPSIQIGNILKVSYVVKKNNDKTISISNHLHKLLASDCDGDCPNIFFLTRKRYADIFEEYKPELLSIDNTGKVFDTIGKDYSLGVSTFLDL